MNQDSKQQTRADSTLIECQLASIISRYFKDNDTPRLIAIGGAGGTGKSTFSKKLANALEETNILHLDDYKTCRYLRKDLGIFGPHPQANEMDLINEHLSMIRSNLVIDKPVYCSDVGRATKTEKYYPKRFNIIEGEVSTYKDFSDIIDFHIFIDSDLDTQLQARMNRDVQSRGYTIDKTLETFVGSNIHEFEKYGSDTKAWADVILFCNRDYSLTISEISSTFHDFFV